MTTWSKHELRKIAEADDLHISPFREEGRVALTSVDNDGVPQGTQSFEGSGAYPKARRRG